MASGLHFMVVLCLTSGLWTEANVCSECETESDECCKRCAPGWTQFDKKCYMFKYSEKDWADAESFCTTIGGNLASIHTTEEYKFIREEIQRVTGSDKNSWVGGYDAIKEGMWLWSDGSKFDFKGWAKGEPNNAATENCMEMNYNGQDYVNDIKCDVKKSFICAKHL